MSTPSADICTRMAKSEINTKSWTYEQCWTVKSWKTTFWLNNSVEIRNKYERNIIFLGILMRSTSCNSRRTRTMGARTWALWHSSASVHACRTRKYNSIFFFLRVYDRRRSVYFYIVLFRTGVHIEWRKWGKNGKNIPVNCLRVLDNLLPSFARVTW